MMKATSSKWTPQKRKGPVGKLGSSGDEAYEDYEEQEGDRRR